MPTIAALLIWISFAASYSTNSTLTHHYLAMMWISTSVLFSTATYMSSIQLLQLSMPLAIILEREECTDNESVRHHHGGSHSRDMIACFWRKILHLQVFVVCMLYKFASSFRLSTIDKSTHVLSCSGSHQSVMSRVRIQGCGWWNLISTIADSV